MNNELNQSSKANASPPSLDLTTARGRATVAKASFARFLRSKQRGDLDQAINLIRSALSKAKANNEPLADYLIQLGQYLGQSYKFSDRLRDLELSEHILQKAVDLIGSQGPDRIQALWCLASVKYPLYLKKKDPLLAKSSLELYLEVIEDQQTTASQTSIIRLSIANLQHAIYKNSKDLGDLDLAIGTIRKAISVNMDATAASNAHQLLAEWLYTRYCVTVDDEKLYNLKNLEDSIKSTKYAMSHVKSMNGVVQTEALNTLGERLFLLYQKGHSREHLDESIQIGEAILLKPDANPIFASFSLSKRLNERSDLESNNDDANRAISLTEQALEAISPQHTDYPTIVNSLGEMIQSRYLTNPIEGDLAYFISLAERAVAAIEQTPTPDVAKLALSQACLGDALRFKFDETKDINDINDAIEAMQRAISLGSKVKLGVALYHSDLSSALIARYEESGLIEDLDQALRHSKMALDLLPTESSQRAELEICHAEILLRDYSVTSAVTSLQAAVSISKTAVESTPKGSRERSGRLKVYASALSERYEHFGVISDLDLALVHSKEAIDCFENSFMEIGDLLNQHASLLHLQYIRTWDIDCLEEAINAAKRAVDSIEDDDSDQGIYCNTLAAQLLFKYAVYSEKEDLDEAIRLRRKGLAILSPNNHLVSRCQEHLALCLLSKYKLTSGIAELEEAICLLDNLVSKSGGITSANVSILNTRGSLLKERAARLNSLEDKVRALQCYKQAWNTLHARPCDRLLGASYALKMIPSIGTTGEGIEIGKASLRLLSTAFPKHATFEDGQFIAESFSGISSSLCSLLVQENRHMEAIQYLERGRTILAHRQINSNIKQWPEGLDDNGDKPSTPLVHENEHHLSNHTTKFGVVYDNDEFLPKLLTKEDLQSVTSGGGYIIIVNVSTFQSDCLMISMGGKIDYIQLPDLDSSRLDKYSQTRWTHKAFSKQAKLQKLFKEYMEWLWVSCVQPILNKLAALEALKVTKGNPPNTGQPRVWWIGTGSASSVPFHAAGIHNKESTDYALYSVISSYAISISALLYCRQHREETVLELRKKTLPISVAIATMETTPGKRIGQVGLDSLPRAVDEGRDVINAWGSTAQHTLLAQPTVKDVMDRLVVSDIFHFACHGITTVFNSMESSLVLQRTDPEVGLPIQDRLTILKLLEITLRRPWLVYLSACSTAQNKVWDQPDEGIHLASSFQLAGFANAVASLWPVDDSACKEVANTFYHTLVGMILNENKGEAATPATLPDNVVAAALHGAVVSSRASNLDRPISWAAFVHYGI